MTKENAKDYLPFVQALTDGKTIQRCSNGKWEDIECTNFTEKIEKYRIKPDVKCKEECLEQNKDGTIQQCELLEENKELEKEKCTLLGILQGKDKLIEKMMLQKKDLCESLEIMNNRESELLNQIAQMKNRLNCSKYHYCLCKDKTCKTCKDWELAE